MCQQAAPPGFGCHPRCADAPAPTSPFARSGAPTIRHQRARCSRQREGTLGFSGDARCGDTPPGGMALLIGRHGRWAGSDDRADRGVFVMSAGWDSGAGVARMGGSRRGFERGPLGRAALLCTRGGGWRSKATAGGWAWSLGSPRLLTELLGGSGSGVEALADLAVVFGDAAVGAEDAGAGSVASGTVGDVGGGGGGRAVDSGVVAAGLGIASEGAQVAAEGERQQQRKGGGRLRRGGAFYEGAGHAGENSASSIRGTRNARR